LKSIFGEAFKSFTDDDFSALPAGAHTFTSSFCEQPWPPPIAACKGAVAVPILHSCAWQSGGSTRKQTKVSALLEAKVIIVHLYCVLVVQTH
jgi:hypothetical protein